MSKSILLLVLLISSCFYFILSHEGADHDHGEPENSNVLVLTDDNFETTVQSNEYVFAEFYAPWCGHCKRLAPEYELVANHFQGSNVIISKVDCTENNGVSTKYGIQGFPTLKFFRNGKPTDYDGGRSATEIIHWITKKTSVPSTEYTNKEQLNNFLGTTGVTKVVGYLSSDNVATFISVASSDGLDDFSFGHVTDPSLFFENTLDTVVLYKSGEPTLTYTGEIDKDKIFAWILAEGFPLVEELAQKIWQRSSSSSTPLLAIFLSDPSKDDLSKEIAQNFKGRVLTSTSSNTQIAERWGTTGQFLPTAVLVSWNGPEPKLSVYDEESGPFTIESGKDFVEKSLAGEYKSYKKSQPIPESNDGPVTVLVGKTFQEIVNNPEKDVFVKFYAPWCGHCKNLAPVWDELGLAFEDVPSVVIAKFDATANSYPDTIDIRGFPTLLFFSADNKEPVPYNGERDLENLKKFVSEQASRAVEKEDL